MKIRTLLAVLLASCLTSCATNHGAFTQPSIHQIRLGQTTEADLVAFYGPPDTRWVIANSGEIQLDWFRSVAPGPAGYVPFIGPFFGGLDLQVQQLTVRLRRDGRVTNYRMYDSNGAVISENARLAGFRK